MHFAPLRKYVFFRSGDTELSTDIAQETFLRVWEKRHTIQPERIKGLLYKIAGDLFVTHYRKEKRSFNFFKHYQPESEARSPEEEMVFVQLQQRYGKVLSEMPEKQRTVFLMSRVDGLKYAEIAEMNDISVKAVEKRMKNALEFLHVNLKTNG